MKKSLLFYPGNIQSHVIPVMNLASHLQNGYEIYVLVMDEKLADIVGSHGFNPILVSPFKVGIGHEAGYLKEEVGKQFTLEHSGNAMLGYIRILVWRIVACFIQQPCDWRIFYF